MDSYFNLQPPKLYSELLPLLWLGLTVRYIQYDHQKQCSGKRTGYGGCLCGWHDRKETVGMCMSVGVFIEQESH